MYSYTVYAYWNQEQLYGLFNAVAIIMGGGGDYLMLLRTVAIVGLISAGVAALAKMRAEGFATYFIMTAMLYGCLVLPKATLTIVDVTGHNAPKVVSNVPWGLGALASTTSHIGYWLTGAYETALSMPNDLAFQKNGMLFGARMLEARQKVAIKDPQLRTDMLSWYKDCLVFQVLDNPYRLLAVKNSVDLWADSKDFMNPGRVVSIYQSSGQVELLDCVSAYAQLETRLAADEANNVIPFLRLYLWAGDPTVDVKAGMTAADTAVLKVGTGAFNTVRQAMMLSIFRDGPASVAAITNNPSMVAIEMAKIQTAQQANSSYEVMRSISESALPLVRNALHTIIIAAFPIVLMMIILGGDKGPGIFASYVSMLIFIELWAPLFAVVNHLLTYASMRDISSVVSSAGGINMDNYNMVSKGLISAQGIAGMLTMSIPIIAYMLVSKGQSAAANLASGITAPSTSAAQAAGSSAAVGNMSAGNVQWGNMQMGNYGWNNQSANKSDTSRSNITGDQGAVTHQRDNATGVNTAYGSFTKVSGGNALASASMEGASALEQKTASRMRSNINSEVTSTGMSLNDSVQATKTDSAALMGTIQEGITRTNAANVTTGKSTSTGNSSDGTQSLDKATATNAGTKNSTQTSNQQNEFTSKEAKAGLSIPGTNIGAGASGGTRDTDSFNRTVDATKSSDTSTRNAAIASLKETKSALDSLSTSNADSSTKSAAKTMSSSIGNTIAAAEAHGVALAKQHTVSQTSSDTDSAGSSISVGSQAKAIEDIVKSAGLPQNDDGYTAAMRMVQQQPDQAAGYLASAREQAMEAKMLNLAGSGPSSSQSDVENQYNSEAGKQLHNDKEDVASAGAANVKKASAETNLSPTQGVGAAAANAKIDVVGAENKVAYQQAADSTDQLFVATDKGTANQKEAQTKAGVDGGGDNNLLGRQHATEPAQKEGLDPKFKEVPYTEDGNGTTYPKG